MLDIGWTELLIIGVVALVVVGPKDLPKMFRTLGQVTGKARAMAREFQSAMDAAADETGVKDIARDLRDTASGRNLREAAGLDEMEREIRGMESDLRDASDPLGARVRKADAAKPASGKAGRTGRKGRAVPPSGGEDAMDDGAMDEAGADEAMAADLEARTAAATAREAERLKRAERAAAARRKAAELRAKRAAEADSAPATPDPEPEPARAPGPQAPKE